MVNFLNEPQPHVHLTLTLLAPLSTSECDSPFVWWLSPALAVNVRVCVCVNQFTKNSKKIERRLYADFRTLEKYTSVTVAEYCEMAEHLGLSKQASRRVIGHGGPTGLAKSTEHATRAIAQTTEQPPLPPWQF